MWGCKRGDCKDEHKMPDKTKSAAVCKACGVDAK